MSQLFKYLKFVFGGSRPLISSMDKKINYSLKKYGKTYKLLEEYDKKAITDPETLAGPGRLQKHIREFQKKTGIQRTYTSV